MRSVAPGWNEGTVEVSVGGISSLAKGSRRDKRERFVAAILDAVSIEPYELEVAEAHAALLAHVRRTGTPRGARDLTIAATARARERQVVSLDQSGLAELPEVSIAGRFG